MPGVTKINCDIDRLCNMHRLDVHDFGSLLHIWLGDISYQASSLIFEVPAFPVLHVSSALWVTVDNILL